jgi:hypothetical protein
MNARIKKFLVALALGVLALLPVAAEAQHHGGGYYRPGHYYGYGPSPRFYGRAWYGGHWYHGWYGGRPGWWWLVGGTWYLYPDYVYPYPDPYAVPLVAIPAPPPSAAGSPYWYWCSNPTGYYPYVSQCSQPWQAVAAGVQVTAPAGTTAGAPPADAPLPPAPPAEPPAPATNPSAQPSQP